VITLPDEIYLLIRHKGKSTAAILKVLLYFYKIQTHNEVVATKDEIKRHTNMSIQPVYDALSRLTFFCVIESRGPNCYVINTPDKWKI
jgi:hypothetical protein